MKKKVRKIKIATVELPKEADSVLASLLVLQASSGWAIIVKILNENITYLEQAILNKIDPVMKCELTDDEVEILRIKRNLNIDLRDTPQNFSKQLTEQLEIPENFDPYFKTGEEIKKYSSLTT
jgi:hypothetical protein